MHFGTSFVLLAVLFAISTEWEERTQTGDDQKVEGQPIEESSAHNQKLPKSRDHVERLLRLRNTKEDTNYEIFVAQQKQLIQKEVIGIFKSTVTQLEELYNFQDLRSASLSENDINSKPLLLFLGTWSTGKSSMINYLLNIENSSHRLYTGAEPTTAEFTILLHGENFKQIDGKVLASTYQFNDLEKFGTSFVEKLKAIQVPRALLERVIVVDTPGTIENKQDRGYSYDEATKWFIERASLIFLLFDPFRINIGRELESIFSIFKGKESKLRIILNKADTVSPRELTKVYGTLLWNISPLSNRIEPPRVYVGSFWGYEPNAQCDKKFLQADEESLLRDINQVILNSAENKISQVRNYAQQVYLHAATVDRYIEVFGKEKSLFGDNELKWTNILDNPEKHGIYDHFLRKPWLLSQSDLPDPELYKKFFKLNKPSKFSPLNSHCSIIWGCPADKIKEAISSGLPKLLVKHQKLHEDSVNDDKDVHTEDL